ncbi:MAG: glutamine--fructose-6-phosphate aminotransferase, partial [Clostridia bacterium]|nr:glutamine--fructose-6-phosphate aminotransferase [Clostridia bacterium]
MCGIVGFVGKKQAAPVLLEGLSKLEYRGYDSAGIAVRDDSGKVKVVKAKGRLKKLAEKIDDGKALKGTIGIGHTRWATHGEPSENNAHPHISDDGCVTGVHNGIIENYLELKDKLTRHGYTFYSQTDTEIAVKLVDYYYKKYNNGPIDAIAKTMVRMRGSYALAIMFNDYPDQVWVARKDSPSSVGLSDEKIKEITGITVVACGSAWHVGMALQYVMEDIARIPVRVEYASEFRYRKPILNKNELVIVISQSGETADSLAALREAKENGITTLGIVNVVGSSIAREADNVFYTLAGPEIAVATTKAYSTQLMAGYCLAVQFGKVRGIIGDEKYMGYISELETIPTKIASILDNKERLQWFASKFANAHDVFFIGRGLDYAIALEGSLKMKEISYIHSEAYAAGELKHGTISLIEKGTLVIGLLTQPSLYEKTLANMVECKARGAYLMGLTSNGNYSIEDTVEFADYVPKVDEHFIGSLEVIPLQLIGYYISCSRGLDVD